MLTRNNYGNLKCKRYQDGSVLAEALADLFRITVEADVYREDGEDPLIKARVSLDYRKDVGGESHTVFLKMEGPEITEDDIHEAIEEFMCLGSSN